MSLSVIRTLNILVVEDDGPNSELLTAVLDRAGYNVTLAMTGAEVFELIDEANPQMILLDIGLPIMDGFQVLAKLREMPKWRALPIIVLTAHHQLNDVAHAVQLGVSGYVTKPFDVFALVDRVDNRLGRPPRYQRTSISCRHGQLPHLVH